MPTIKLETMPDAAAFAGKYDICVDEQTLNTVKSKTINEFSIEAGTHTLLVRVGATSSQPLSFELEKDETKTYGIGIATGPRTARRIGLILGLAAIVVGLMMMSGSVSFGVVVLVCLLVFVTMIYSFSTRSRFFSITELEKEESGS